MSKSSSYVVYDAENGAQTWETADAKKEGAAPLLVINENPADQTPEFLKLAFNWFLHNRASQMAANDPGDRWKNMAGYVRHMIEGQTNDAPKKERAPRGPYVDQMFLAAISAAGYNGPESYARLITDKGATTEKEVRERIKTIMESGKLPDVAAQYNEMLAKIQQAEGKVLDTDV